MERTIEGIRTENPRLIALLSGELSVEDLDAEELAKGRVRCVDGTFRGRPRAEVPRAIYEAMQREILKRGEALWRESYEAAIMALVRVATDPNPMVKDGDRVTAAKYIVERVAGKVPDKLIVADADPWQQIIDDIIVEDVPTRNPQEA